MRMGRIRALFVALVAASAVPAALASAADRRDV